MGCSVYCGPFRVFETLKVVLFLKIKIPVKAIVAIALTIFVCGSVIAADSIKTIYGSIPINLAWKLSEITSVVQDNFYFETDENEIEHGVVSGYISNIGDKYAAYYNEDSATALKNRYSGNSHGIGMLCVNTKDSEIYVWRTFSGGSAENAGLKSGDIITHINDKKVSELGYKTAAKKLQGKNGKSTDITFLHNGVSKTATVTFGDYDVQSVYYSLKSKNIGYIQIINFNNKTSLQFQNAVEQLKGEGAEKFIIDLRHNGGGTIDSAAKILDYLLPSGDIIHVKNKSGEISVRNRSDEKFLDAPIVILVDDESASASEILVSAMKDFGAATIMGTKTYGKSLIQRTFTLKDGSMIKITVGEYIRADGTSYNGIGLEPDIHLTPSYNNDYEYYFMSDKEDSMLLSAIAQLS